MKTRSEASHAGPNIKGKKKRQLSPKEILKTVCILLLSVSFVILAAEALLLPQQNLTTLLTHLLIREAEVTTQRAFQAASVPVRMAVYSESGRRGLQYDTTEVNDGFAQVSGLFAEALGTAAAPAPMEEAVWRAALERTGCYIEFLDPVPLDALAAWISGETGNPALTHESRRILLWEGDEGEAFLSYINAEDGLYYTCGTGEILKDRLPDALSSFLPNEASFAFALGEEYEDMDPYTMISPLPYFPLVTGEGFFQTLEQEETLLTVLGFNAHTMSSYGAGSATVYRQDDHTIRIQADGTVRYTCAGEQEDWAAFPIEGEGETLKRTEAIEGARSLAAKLTELCWGEGVSLYLSKVEATESGYLISFGCSVSGAPVLLAGGDHMGEFEVADGRISSFSFCLRKYAVSGTHGVQLPERQAMAAFSDMEEEGRELTVGYVDEGQSVIGVQWMMR